MNETLNDLNTAADKLNKAALGAINRLAESGRDWFRTLVEAGESKRAEQAKGTGKNAAARQDSPLDEWRVRLAHGLGLPTREEMESLDKKLNRISRKVNKLAREQKDG